MNWRVAIDRIAAGGDGVGHLDEGMVVFVPRSAPGDMLEVELTVRKARFARGRISEVLNPGPGRVEPSCDHYEGDACGGCQLQHLSVECQCEAKRSIVGDALRRIGKLDVSDPEIVSSPEAWRYRSKIRLVAKQGQIGFHRYDRPDRSFDLTDCMIAGEEVMELWRCVSANRALLPRQLKSLVVRTDRTGGRHLLAIGGESPWDAEPMERSVGGTNVSYWWKPDDGAPRVVAGPETGYPPVAFDQMNAKMADDIRRAAIEGLGEVSGKVVWDLYGGVGDTAELLSERGASVWSVDADRSAVEWGAAQSTHREFGGGQITRIVGRAEETVHRLPGPDMVIVNPPRTGLEKPLTEWLRRWAEGLPGVRLAYVSCDPATLARDLSRMPSLAVEAVVAYDLFPQTGHVETLTVLEAA